MTALRAWFQHHLNARHVCCRLMDMRVPPKVARAIARWWERATLKLLYPRRGVRR